VREVNAEALGAGMLRIKELFDKAAQRGVLAPEEAMRHLGNVRGTTAWEGFETVDLVVEAAIEELTAKQAIFRELEEHTPGGAMLATNTSSLSVADLQKGLKHPERVGGLHFFNPVHKMFLVEVVRGPATPDTVLRRLTAFAARLGKTPVVVKDGPGFVVNRILMPYLGEAILWAVQGMPIEQIDQAMRRFGMPMGPLELLDQIGLDVAAHVGRSLRALAEGRFAPLSFNPEEVFARMAEKGWLGQKSGKGFYQYSGKRKKRHRAAVDLLSKAAGADQANLLKGLPLSALVRHAQQTMVLAMVNEAAACLGEGIAKRASDIDLAMILGTAWAPHRGGPLRYADDRGLGDVVKSLEELAQRAGPRFEACAELRGRAERKESFYPKTDLSGPPEEG
jgi:3-hydroxyacyl-CoA dehydrogenase/enoyl-CoA hydratase/3-hydroxybutyryl-CoA epimerase